jgi:hypothetical protein
MKRDDADGAARAGDRASSLSSSLVKRRQAMSSFVKDSLDGLINDFKILREENLTNANAREVRRRRTDWACRPRRFAR